VIPLSSAPVAITDLTDPAIRVVVLRDFGAVLKNAGDYQRDQQPIQWTQPIALVQTIPHPLKGGVWFWGVATSKPDDGFLATRTEIMFQWVACVFIAGAARD
jgi:hypothetical protein